MSTSEPEVTYITPGEEQTDDPKGVDLEEASNISQSNDWLSSPKSDTEKPQTSSPATSSNQINDMSTTSDSSTLPLANSSTNEHVIPETQVLDMKKVLADRLRKRIEDREAGIPSEPFLTNGIKKEETNRLELESQEDLNDLDFIEGFQICADDAPTDISKLPQGQYTLDSPTQRPIRRKTPSVKITENYFTFNPLANTGVSPPKPKELPVIQHNSPAPPVAPVHTVSKTAHTSYFGPHVIKKALRSMNNRATAVEITDWIVANLPQYLHYFGDKKKLRYSVVGILSAKAYATIFQKEIVVEKGTRKSDWILTDPNDIDDESNFLPMAAVSNFLPPVENLSSNVTDISANASIGSALEPPSEYMEKMEPSVAPVPDPYERKDCVICGQGTDDNKLLLCDSCDSGYHIYCLQPPLKTIPRGAWYCTSCIAQGHAPAPTAELSEDESAFDHPPGEDDLDRDTEEEQEGVPRHACDKHRKWKKRCPPDCTNRPKLKTDKDIDASLMIPRYKKKGQSKRKNRDNEGYRRSKKARGGKESDAPTYIDMIEEAIKALGGQATTPDITNFMESHYGNLLATKTKTWRNSVSGCLSTHFERSKTKEGDGRAIWTLAFPAEDAESEVDFHGEEDDFFDDMEIIELQSEPSPSIPSYKTRSSSVPAKAPPTQKFKAPKRRAHVVFEPYRLEELRADNPDEYEILNPTPISFINKTHPLDVLEKNITHPGGVMRLVWSNDLTKLASVSTLGSIRIWNIENWTMIKEIKDKEEANIDEFFALEWSPDDTKLIVAGKLKDRKKWDPEEEEYASLPSSIKIFDIESGTVTMKLEGHTSDVLDIKLLSFCHQLYLISAGADGSIRKWNLSDDLSTLTGTSTFGDYGSKLAVCIQFVPGTGKKFFFVACDTGMKLFDFDTEQLVQDFPDIYTYLCDSIKFIKWLDAPRSEEETQSPSQYPPLYILTKGVELLDQQDKVVRPNVCHLHRFEIPEGGKGKFKLEIVSAFTHQWYNSNIWQTRLNSNGRYALCPTTEGKVFVWNLKSKEIVAMLHEHGNREVRDIVFHPKLRMMVTCADDSMIRVYNQKEIENELDLSGMPSMVPNVQETSTISMDTESNADPVPMKIKTNEDEHVDIDSDNANKDGESTPPLRKSARVSKPSSFLSDDMDLSEFYKSKTSPSNSPNFGSGTSSPGSGSEKKKVRGPPGACEQHKRDHVKCPADCPGRTQ